MKPWLVKLLIGAIGFGGGFAAGFFCHKKMNDVKFEEITMDEMNAIEESVRKEDIHSDYSGSVAQAEKKEDPLKADEALPTDPEDLHKVLQGKTSYVQADADQKTAYEKLWKATKDYSSEENANNIPVIPVENTGKGTDEAEGESPQEEDFDEEFLEQLEQEAVEAGNSFASPPYEIDLASFYNERPDYDKVTIRYYEPDNTWVDEHGDVIPDISSYTGTNKNPFSTPGLDSEEDTRFIRNEHYNADYELIRHHRSWSEETGEKG